jgi:branched-chain amino acid transport system substrate-binding protein
VAVKAGLAAVLSGNPEAVIMVGPYKPVAEFTRQARAAGVKAVLATISFVGTESLIAELGAQSEGIVISQVVPPPTDPALPLAQSYRGALEKGSPGEAPSYTSFEGYIGGRVLLAGMEKAGKDATREQLIQAIEGLTDLDLGGLKLSYSGQSHQGLKAVFLTIVASGKAQAL